MATVYLAVQESLSRYVALKVMNQALVADADFCRRFLNEGRLIAKLSHPNIVTVFDIGASGGIHYLSMTYLPGGTLRDKIHEGLSLDRTLHVLTRLADALGYAHARGIVHRDIKPGNVLFTDNGAPVLTDFGIAKTVGNQTQLTSAGITFGSVGYMSPEQCMGQAVDNRSDLYGLGVLLWQMLTGALPYAAQDPFALALKHAMDPIPRLPESLSRLQPVIDGLMAKKPEDRLPSAESLLELLDEIRYEDLAPWSSEHTDETLVLPRALKRTPSRPTTPSAIDAQPAPDAKRRFSVAPVFAAVAALAAIGGYVGYRGLGSPDADAPTASQSVPASPAEGAQDLNVSPALDGSKGMARQGSSLPSPNVPHAQGAPDGASPSPKAEGTQVILGADPQTNGPQVIETLLRQAEGQWSAGRLTEPPGDNAFESYSRVLDLEPEHGEAKQRLVQIGRINAANRMFLSADRLLRQGAIDDARRMIETGLKLNPDDERLLGLQRALDYRQ